MNKDNWLMALANNAINNPMIYLLEQNIEQILVFYGYGVM
jgi:hypothetical protein